MNRISGLYVIVGDEPVLGKTPAEITRAAVAGGAKLVQFRAKSLPTRERYTLALSLRSICKSAGALFIVNDSVDVALAVCADGVHLGQDDLPLSVARRLAGSGMIIGVSTHSVDEATQAERGGADYIGFGPMFHTSTKDVASPFKGSSGMREVRAVIGIPIAAIGGINAGNARSIIEGGADALAVISAVTGAVDVEEAAREIASAFNK